MDFDDLGKPVRGYQHGPQLFDAGLSFDHWSVCGHHPRMELSPNAIIEAIADREFESRTGHPFKYD